MRLSIHQKCECSFCGHKIALAEWRGHKDIACCASCATEFLPALIGDAAVVNNEADAHRLLERVQLRLWRALTLRLLNTARREA